MAKQKKTLLQKADFQAYLEDKAREMAPRDVEVLLSQADTARTRALADQHPRLGAQMVLALELLADHDDGQCPQIPYYTISLLAEAVYYFLDPNDVIPDWIPDIGKLDDALIMELAFELGAEGIHRYCAWKEVDIRTLYQVQEAAAPEKSGADKGRATAKTGAAKKSKSSAGKSKGKSAKKKSAAKTKVAKSTKKPAAKKRIAKKQIAKKQIAKKRAVAKKQANKAAKRGVAKKAKTARRKSR